MLEAILWLALNVYHEARSEPFIGQVAVAQVTLNRSHYRGKTIKEVVLAPRQFSWTHQKTNYVPDDMQAMAQALKAAIAATKPYDITGGATHYHRDDVIPYWANAMHHTVRYGRHIFYKENN